ncbi:MAG: recombinase family protein [Pseudomonadota bacterium]
MTKLGYLRVSTKDQRPGRQIEGLAALCDELHVEHASAATRQRPVDQAVIGRLEPGDTLVVASLDRAFRSTVDAINEAERLIDRGVHFEIVTLNVDTSTADGMLAYSIVAAVATHERMRISERTKQGLEAARRRGVRLGRPPKLGPADLAQIAARLEEEGATITAIAAEHGMAPWSLSRALKRSQSQRPDG